MRNFRRRLPSRFVQPVMNPARFFLRSGSRGFMFEPSDFSTLFQDTGGTTAVTTTGQAVALMRDKSGLGNHATQATAGNRPVTTTLNTSFRGIAFDGATSNRWLQTAAIDFSNSDEVTVVAGVRKLSDAARGKLVELGPGSAPRFNLEAPDAAGASSFLFGSGGTLIVSAGASGFSAPNTAVLTGVGDISGDSVILRRNGSQVASNAADQGTGNYPNSVVTIGRGGGGSFFFNGVITFLFAINRLLSATELASVERYANSRTGAY